MGRDKATLPLRGKLLAETIAETIEQAIGHVAFVGETHAKSTFSADKTLVDVAQTHGWTIHPDMVPNCGPMGGLLSALQASVTPWNLLIACDMPDVSRSLIEALLAPIHPPVSAISYDVIVAETGGRVHPLCGVYHARIVPLVARAIETKMLKMHDLLAQLRVLRVPVQPSWVRNVNTPEQWRAVDNPLILNAISASSPLEDQ
jgi:molybdopterin-guanine dinucleotide biosynthesis protein A